MLSLGFDDRDWKTRFDLQHVVGTERTVAGVIPTAAAAPPDRDDLAVSAGVLLHEPPAPASGFETRDDVVAACVFLKRRDGHSLAIVSEPVIWPHGCRPAARHDARC